MVGHIKALGWKQMRLRKDVDLCLSEYDISLLWTVMSVALLLLQTVHAQSFPHTSLLFTKEPQVSVCDGCHKKVK